MKAAQIQQQLKLNAQVIAGLHQELTNLKSARKAYNKLTDFYASEANNAGTMEAALEAESFAKNYQHQASLYTPFIKKFVRKIAVMDDIQRALKHELKCAACMEAWMAEDDAEWIEVARLAAEGGHAPQHVVDDFLIQFGSKGD